MPLMTAIDHIQRKMTEKKRNYEQFNVSSTWLSDAR